MVIDEFYPIPIEAKIGACEIRIWLPQPASAIVHGKVGIGSVDILGHQSAGLGVSRTGGDVIARRRLDVHHQGERWCRLHRCQ